MIDGGCEMMDVLHWLFQKVEGKPQSASTADSGKRAYGINCFRKKL